MNQKLAQTGLRLALGTAFLSAVGTRLGVWDWQSGHWPKFVKACGQVNWFLPAALIPAVAVAATVCETTFGLLLVIGWQVRSAAYGSAGLLMLFALAMASGDLQSPFDYSVFSASMGALLLATTYDPGRTK